MPPCCRALGWMSCYRSLASAVAAKRPRFWLMVTVRCPRRSVTVQERLGWGLSAVLSAVLAGSADDGVGAVGSGAGKGGGWPGWWWVVVLEAADERLFGGEDLQQL